MTEEIQQQEEEQAEIDFKAFYEAHKETVEKLPGLLNKQKELLAETKAAKEEKRRIEEMTKQEQKALAEKNGEFEKLFRQRDEDYKRMEQELLQFKQNSRNEKIEVQATRLANELAKGDPAKAELLATFVAKSISNIADDVGSVDNDALSSIKKQIESDSRYAPLLGGNLSQGGSAPGNTRSAGVSVTMKRAEFNTLPLNKQAEFVSKVREGKAQLVD